MIRSFKSKKLRHFFEADDAAGLPAGQAEKIGDILAAITGNWQLIFRFDVDLVDYH